MPPVIRTTGKIECEYLIADLVPPCLVFLIGIVVASILACNYYCKCCKCNAIGSTLINWMYGGPIIPSPVALQNEQKGLNIENIKVDKTEHKCLKCCLITNAFSLLTFAAIIFSSIFFVESNIESDFANSNCPTDRDCFIYDGNYMEAPIGNNCSFYTNSSYEIICYNFNLSLLSALGNVGGTLLVTTLAIGLITKILIWCLNCCHFCTKKKCRVRKSQCAECCCKLIGFVPLLLAIIAITVVIHLSVFHDFTWLTHLKLAIPCFSILITLCITCFTPWMTLVRSQPLGPIYLRQEYCFGRRVTNAENIGPFYLKPTGEESDENGQETGSDIFPNYYLFSPENTSANFPDLVCLIKKVCHSHQELDYSRFDPSNESWPKDVEAIYSIQFRGDRLPENFLIRNTLNRKVVKGPFYYNEELPLNDLEKNVRIIHKNLPKVFLELEQVGGKIDREENRNVIGPVTLVPHFEKDNKTVYALDFKKKAEIPSHPVFLTAYYKGQNPVPLEQNRILEAGLLWYNVDHPLPYGAHVYTMRFQANQPPTDTILLGDNDGNVEDIQSMVPTIGSKWRGPICTNYLDSEEIELTKIRTDNQPIKIKMRLILSKKTTGTPAYTLSSIDKPGAHNLLYLIRFYHENDRIPKNLQEKLNDHTQWPTGAHVYTVKFKTSIPKRKLYLKSIDSPNARLFGPFTPDIPNGGSQGQAPLWIGPIYFDCKPVNCEITLQRIKGKGREINSPNITAQLVPSSMRPDGTLAYRLHVPSPKLTPRVPSLEPSTQLCDKYSLTTNNEIPISANEIKTNTDRFYGTRATNVLTPGLNNSIYLTNFYHTDQLSSEQCTKLENNGYWRNDRDLYSIKIKDAPERFYLKNSDMVDAPEHGPLSTDTNDDKLWVGPIYINSEPLGPIYLTRGRGNPTIGPMYLILTEIDNGDPEYRLRYHGDTQLPNSIYLTSIFYTGNNEVDIQRNAAKQNDPADRYLVHFLGKLPSNTLTLRNADVTDTTQFIINKALDTIGSQQEAAAEPIGRITILRIYTEPLGPIYITLEQENETRVQNAPQQTYGPMYLIFTEKGGNPGYRLRYLGNTKLPNNIHLTSFFYTGNKPQIVINHHHLYSVHFQGNLPPGQTEFTLRNADITDTDTQSITEITDNPQPIPITILSAYTEPLGPIYITLERENETRVQNANQQTFGPMYLIFTEKGDNPGYRLHNYGHSHPQGEIHLTSFFYTGNKPDIFNDTPEQNQKWNGINHPRLYSVHFQGNLPPKQSLDQLSGQTSRQSQEQQTEFILKNVDFTTIQNPIEMVPKIGEPQLEAIGPITIYIHPASSTNQPNTRTREYRERVTDSIDDGSTETLYPINANTEPGAIGPIPVAGEIENYQNVSGIEETIM